MNRILPCIHRAISFQKEAHIILSFHETSKSRVVLIEDTYNQLGKLSINQDELFRQALRCIENSLFRASHVMAWAGFIDFLVEKLSVNQFSKLHVARPKWIFKTADELRENYTEYAIIEASKITKLCNNSEMKILHGLLSKRNECAHPSSYFPELNESLGYISELFKRIAILKSKNYY